MPRRPGVTREAIVDAAAELLEADGVDGLSLANVAKRFGVKTPSLYSHIAGLDDLRRLLRLRGLQQLGEELQRAAVGRSGLEALRAVAGAYRDYAKAKPALYALTQQAVPRSGAEGATAADDDASAASRQVVEVVLAVLRGYGLEGEDAIHATRVLRSALHGFVALETGGGFGMPADTEETFGRLVALLDGGLRRLPVAGERP